jgi:hypothetical protein
MTWNPLDWLLKPFPFQIAGEAFDLAQRYFDTLERLQERADAAQAPGWAQSDAGNGADWWTPQGPGGSSTGTLLDDIDAAWAGPPAGLPVTPSGPDVLEGILDWQSDFDTTIGLSPDYTQRDWA